VSGVVLGGILLRGFEVPEQISFGGAQRLAVHRLPGGSRVIDAMGSDDREITWSGMMIGPEAADRARALDGLREAGQAVSLVFGDMAYNVVVASFEAAYRRSNWIGAYRIGCMVIPGVADQPISVSEALAGAIGSVVTIDPDGAVSGLSEAVQAAQNGLSSADALVGGTSGVIALASSLQAAANIAVGAQSVAEAAMQDAITSAAAGGGAIGGTAGLTVIGAQAEQLAKSGAAVGLIGQATLNLTTGAM
jgi:hypothetical protein